MRQHYPYSKKLRQFRYLAKRISRMLKSGESPEVNQQWVDRLNRLYNELSGLFAGRYLKRMAGAAVIALTMGLTTNAQSFGPAVENPFGLTTVGSDMALGDLDGDGDLDIIGIEYIDYTSVGFAFFENTGTAASPTFSTAPVSNPFSLPLLQITNDFSYNIESIDLVDIDNDGDLDLMAYTWDLDYVNYSQTHSMILHRNTGTATAPDFQNAPETMFSSTPGPSISGSCSLGDIDGDGDIDAIHTTYEAYNYTDPTGINLYLNNGTPSAPSFGQPQADPFGLNTSSWNEEAYWPELADLDNDGNLDLLLVKNAGLLYYENTGNSLSPSFGAGQPNPSGINTGSFQMRRQFVETGDMDNDGDADMFLAQPGNVILYLENTGQSNVGIAERTTNEGIIVYPNPSEGLVSVQLKDFSVTGASRFEVTNAMGQLVLTGNLSNGRTDIDLSDYPSGVYTLSIHEEQLIRTTRLVKN